MFIENFEKSILENDLFKIFQKLNTLISEKKLSLENSKELYEIYNNISKYLSELDKSQKDMKRSLKVIEGRYPEEIHSPSYILMKKISENNFFDNLSSLLKNEAYYFLDGNVVDYHNTLVERQKLTFDLEKLCDVMQKNNWKIFTKNFLHIKDFIIVNSYFMLDKMLIMIFPGVQNYRKYTFAINNYCDIRFKEFIFELNPELRPVMQHYYNIPSYRNYVWIMAQITFIDYDVFFNNGSQKFDKLCEAGFRSGMDFLFIKVVDEIIDGNKLGNNSATFIDAFEKAMSGEEYAKLNNDLDAFLQIVYLFQKYHSHSPERKIALNYLKRVNERFMATNKFARKIIYAKSIGKLSADLMIYDAEIVLGKLPEDYRLFLQKKGITGNLFDDWKDYNIDIAGDYGYDSGKRLRVLAEMLHQYYKTLKTMDLSKKLRFMNFCILAGLFQISEIANVKERT